MRKMSTFDPAEFGVTLTGDQEPDLLFVSWGSTVGPIEETAARLASQGVKVGQMQVSVLHPFPTDAVKEAITAAKNVLVVENNAFGQLEQLLKLMWAILTTSALSASTVANRFASSRLRSGPKRSSPSKRVYRR